MMGFKIINIGGDVIEVAWGVRLLGGDDLLTGLQRCRPHTFTFVQLQ